MTQFDWHSDQIERTTPMTSTYRNTQNVRRFMKSHCGSAFKFDRAFMQWMKDGSPKSMGDVVDEWNRRKVQRT